MGQIGIFKEECQDSFASLNENEGENAQKERKKVLLITRWALEWVARRK